MTDTALLHQTAKKYEREMVRFARDLVAIPSFSCQEGRLVARIRKEMERAGFDAVKVYPGPRLFADDAFLDHLFQEIGVKHDTLSAGATVAHTAFFYACHLGCDPIIFVGQDLSFPYNVTHVPGTATHKSWFPELNRFYTYEMKEWDQVLRMRSILIRRKDVKGNPVYVDEQMLSYLKDFTMHFAKSGRRVVNATEGGALTEGVELLSLSEARQKYLTREIPEELFTLPGSDPEELRARLAQGDRSLASRLEDLDRMGEHYETSLALLKRILARAEQKKPFQHLVGEVLRVKEKLKAYDHLYGLLCNLAAADNRKSQHDDQRTYDRAGTAVQVGRGHHRDA